MMKLKKNILVTMSLFGSFFVTVQIYAADIVPEVSVGTTGLGVHASIPLEKDLHVRFGMNYMQLSTVMKDTDGDTNVNVTLNTIDALVDWFPLQGGFHISGGLVYNGNRIDTTTTLNGLTFKGITYTPFYGKLGEVDGSFKVGNIISPYIGIGWGNAGSQTAGWGFTSDLGLLYQGKPQVTLRNRSCTADPATCALIAKGVADEEARLNDEYAGKTIYPVARAGASYRF